MSVFVLKTQLPPAGEVHRDCLDAPEEMDAELYLRSLTDDIKALSIVQNVERSGFVLNISVDVGVKQAELKAAMRPLFSGDRFCTLRFVSLEPAIL